MANRKGLAWVWPVIVDIRTSRETSLQGVWASAWIAGVTAFLALLSTVGVKLMDFDLGALIDAVLFMIIGWGIFKLSRTAALAGLCLYLLERIYMWATIGPKNPIIAIIISLMFINSVRGTFAFHRFSRYQKSNEVASNLPGNNN